MKWAKLLFAFLVIVALYLASSFFTEHGMDGWYGTLVKAPWTPPPIAFMIVWPLLYLTIVVSFWLVLKQSKPKKRALTAFSIHLGFHFLWPICFFYLGTPLMGLICMIFLIATLLWTMREFYPLSQTACYILIPYLIWLLFALSLNSYILFYN